MTPARRTAFRTLLAVDRGALAADTLDALSTTLDARDAGLASELVFGTLRRRAQLHFLLSQRIAKPVMALDAEVRIALELGAYQLRFLTRVPAHAAVAESVELVKQAKKASAAGLVNAVLRRLPALPAHWPDAATQYSMPQWLLDRWTHAFGRAASDAAKAFLSQPPVYVRAAEPSPGLEPTEVLGCYLAAGDIPPGARIQDISSQAVVPLLDLHPGHVFLDLCAAPGNKTAQALETPLHLAVACDASPKRLADLVVPEGQCARVLLDARQPLPFGRVFDRILVDAPCSGTGTIGRNPEIRWRLTLAEIERHAARQKAILGNALECLKPGGVLVYSTCSLEPEENEEVVHEIAPGRVQSTSVRLPGRDPGDGFKAAVIT